MTYFIFFNPHPSSSKTGPYLGFNTCFCQFPMTKVYCIFLFLFATEVQAGMHLKI